MELKGLGHDAGAKLPSRNRVFRGNSWIWLNMINILKEKREFENRAEKFKIRSNKEMSSVS
jgi:hypothetical protein